MAKVTLADRLAIKKPMAPQGPKPPSSTPAPAIPKTVAPKQPKAAQAAKVPGVNAKIGADTSGDTFNNPNAAPKAGRPVKDTMKPTLQKGSAHSVSLNDEQKHRIISEVNQTLGQKNLASGDPVLQQTGREQQAKYGKPGDPHAPMPTAITQIKKPAVAIAPSSSDAKTKVERKTGSETAPLTTTSNVTAPLQVPKSASGTAIEPMDHDKTATQGAVPRKAPSPLLAAPKKDRSKQIARINTELGYNNLKSPDTEIRNVGKQLLSQAPLKEKARYRGNQIIGALRTAISKNESLVTDLKKTDVAATSSVKPDLGPKKKKKKDPYEPKVKVTQAYRAPGSFDASKFIMGVLGSGSPVANRVLGAAKQAFTKSSVEEQWENLSKAELNQHVIMLRKIHLGEIDAPSLVTLLKKS